MNMPGNRTNPRHLMRWTVEHDQRLLLCVQYVCNEKGIKLPWDAIAKLLDSKATEGAVLQHLAKLRSRLVEQGLEVPPTLRRGGTNSSPRVSAASPVTPGSGRARKLSTKMKTTANVNKDEEKDTQVASEAEEEDKAVVDSDEDYKPAHPPKRVKRASSRKSKGRTPSRAQKKARASGNDSNAMSDVEDTVAGSDASVTVAHQNPESGTSGNIEAGMTVDPRALELTSEAGRTVDPRVPDLTSGAGMTVDPRLLEGGNHNNPNVMSPTATYRAETGLGGNAAGTDLMTAFDSLETGMGNTDRGLSQGFLGLQPGLGSLEAAFAQEFFGQQTVVGSSQIGSTPGFVGLQTGIGNTESGLTSGMLRQQTSVGSPGSGPTAGFVGLQTVINNPGNGFTSGFLGMPTGIGSNLEAGLRAGIDSLELDLSDFPGTQAMAGYGGLGPGMRSNVEHDGGSSAVGYVGSEASYLAFAGSEGREKTVNPKVINQPRKVVILRLPPGYTSAQFPLGLAQWPAGSSFDREDAANAGPGKGDDAASRSKGVVPGMKVVPGNGGLSPVLGYQDWTDEDDADWQRMQRMHQEILDMNISGNTGRERQELELPSAAMARASGIPQYPAYTPREEPWDYEQLLAEANIAAQLHPHLADPNHQPRPVTDTSGVDEQDAMRDPADLTDAELERFLNLPSDDDDEPGPQGGTNDSATFGPPNGN